MAEQLPISMRLKHLLMKKKRKGEGREIYKSSLKKDTLEENQKKNIEG